MLYRVLVAALIAMSASVTSAAPAALDAGDALEARMAKLEANLNELEFVDKVEKLAEEHGVKKQSVNDWFAASHQTRCVIGCGRRGRRRRRHG